MYASEIVRAFRRRRRQLGITQPELAERVGIALDTLVRYERGQRKPRLDDAVALAQELGLELELKPCSESEATRPPTRVR